AAIHSFRNGLSENTNVGIFSNGSTARNRFGLNEIVGSNNGILAINGGEPAGPAGDAGRAVSAIRSEHGFGTSTRVPGVASTAAERPAAERPDDPSGLRVLGLLALGVLLAAGVGLASRAAHRTV
ncbi:MAG TPA: hypothetical protein VHF89_12910, partial [Solirubrobacteraceae bacterium]|nr:hypothetical protein [Solirubrobacteraceae bacterium]